MSRLSGILLVLVLTGCFEKTPDGKRVKDGVTCEPTEMYIYEVTPVGWRQVYICDPEEVRGDIK